ncbi:MAG: hypothetical protein RMK52_02260 [Chitinophagales bacterium]|nr:hypothetical protein [Chitinophagales bacterium]
MHPVLCPVLMTAAAHIYGLVVTAASVSGGFTTRHPWLVDFLPSSVWNVA